MKTAEHLEQMTDRGKFEELANSILRDAEAFCRNLIPFGINSQGETIKGPNDGFWKVPGSSPRHYIYLEHTTTDLKSLRNKWLSENGDHSKAGKSARELKEKDTKEIFTVILSTNQRIPSEEWLIDIYKRAEGLDLEVIIWEQSKYVDYLDTNPRGHYLRKKYFQIKAELLSRDLLYELCLRSCEQYKNIYLQFSDPSTWVGREIERDIISTFKKSQYGAGFLLGDSGYGKSVIAYRLLSQHLINKHLGIFIPEKIIEESTFLEEALRNMLNKQYPSLQPEEVDKITEFVSDDLPFLVIVDDINHSGNQNLLIDKITSWAKKPFFIVCPVSSKFSKNVNDKAIQRNVRIFAIERMTYAETYKAIQIICDSENIPISETGLYELARKLNYDPWLIGEFSRQIKSCRDLDQCVIESVEESITRRLNQISSESSDFLENDYSDALHSLSLLMLQNYNIHPDWKIIKEWFKDEEDTINILRSLCLFANLCFIHSENQFLFLHDRLLEFFCVNAIDDIFNESDLQKDLLSEPFYAEIIGQALIKYPQPSSTLDLLVNINPLSIIISLRFIGKPTNEYHHEIFTRVRQWIAANAGNYSSSSPEYLRGEVAYSLLQTDSSLVLDLPETNFGLQKHWLGWLVRLRNGDAGGAIKYCETFGMSLGLDGQLFYHLMEHAKVYNHNLLVETFLSNIQSNDNIKKAQGVFIVAGFIADQELHAEIAEYWELFDKKQTLLFPALWAAFRCSPNYSEDTFLENLMELWNDEKDHVNIFNINHLGGLLNVYSDESLVEFLINEASKFESLQIQIAKICGLIALPNALEFAIKVSVESVIEQRNSFTFHWGSELFPRLSSGCIKKLRDLWNNSNEINSVRILAFDLWIKNNNYQKNELIEILSDISSDQPYFEEATRERATLGDKNCVPNLADILKSDVKNFYFAHYVWCDEIKYIAEEYLQEFSVSIPDDFSGERQDEHYALAYLLRNLSNQYAENLLVKYWGCLGYSPLFIQAALYTGTDKSLSLAATSINKCLNKENLFKHIDQFFGVFGNGMSIYPEQKQPSLDMKKIFHLEPYLKYLDDSCLNHFAASCYMFGDEAIKWCKKNFPKKIYDYYRKIYCPTENDLMCWFDMYSNRSSYSINEFMDRIEKLNLSHDNIMSLLERWLQSSSDINKLRFASECIILLGKRKDLNLLEVGPLDVPIYQSILQDIKENMEFAVKRRTLD